MPGQCPTCGWFEDGLSVDGPHCGSHGVIPIGNAGNMECRSCGWPASECLGGKGFEMDGYHKSREAAT